MSDPNHQNLNQIATPKKLKSHGLPRDMLAALLLFPGIAVVALFVSFLIPTGNPIKNASRQIQCQMNLSSLGSCIFLYQIEHNQNPPNLEALVEFQSIDPQKLICPLSDDTIGDISYIYRGNDLPMDASDETILIYDKKGNHLEDDSEFIRHVLFADFKVRRIEIDNFAAVINRDNELRRELGLPEKPEGK
ncbi:MAG: hypothetical protein GY869_03880 [Planctomycetes bacterium]|nr:hypothetical protein [Planctomycetota bacterium]